jgi:hypothetical protein
MSHLIAGIDESLRPGNYLLCAAVISTDDRSNMRQILRGLLLPNQRRLHAHTERDGRRRLLLKAMCDIPGIDCRLAIGQQRRAGARDACFRVLMANLLEAGVREVMIERVDHGTAKLDRMTMCEILRRRLDECEWRHEAPEHEPLLWIADAVASAYGAGGEWRQLVEPLVKDVWRLDSA